MFNNKVCTKAAKCQEHLCSFSLTLLIGNMIKPARPRALRIRLALGRSDLIAAVVCARLPLPSARAVPFESPPQAPAGHKPARSTCRRY